MCITLETRAVRIMISAPCGSSLLRAPPPSWAEADFASGGATGYGSEVAVAFFRSSRDPLRAPRCCCVLCVRMGEQAV